MVDVDDIPDFPGRPGQRPAPGSTPTVTPVAVVLVTAPLDRDYRNVALNAAAVDTFIQAEIAAGRAHEASVERWSPWSPLQIQLGYAAGAPYNYARFQLGGRYWYAFLSAEYLNLTDTRYSVEPDEWTTYGPTIGYSMVERGHVAVAASQDDTYGDRYLTAPEPIDAPPIRGVLSAGVLGSTPEDWTVLVVSANDLRGGTGNPFWDHHVNHDLIQGAANLASSATIDSSGTVLAHIPDAEYPWAVGGSGSVGGSLVDTISPGHPVTNPGGTFTSGWTWHVEDGPNPGYGGVDLAYNFQEFTAPAAGTVSHFDVAGVGMVVKLVLDTPVTRVLPQEPAGYDAEGPIVAVWFEHCSAAVDGHHYEGEVIGTSGDGYGQYAPHLHVHGLTDTGNVARTNNRSQFFDFIGGSPSGDGPDVYVPKVSGSPVSTIDGVSAGGGCYLFSLDGFAQYMTIMQGAPWITSGIVDVRLVPSWAIGTGGSAAFDPAKASTDPSDPMWTLAAGIPVFVGELDSATVQRSVLNGWRETVLGLVGDPTYRKLIAAPFTDLMVGNGDGLRSFRPDQWKTPEIGFEAVAGGAHGDPSIRLIPTGYNDLGPQLGIDVPIGGQGGLAHSGYGIAGSNTASQDMTPYLTAFSSQLTWATTLKNKELAITLGLEKIQLGAGVQGVQTALGVAQGAAGGMLSGGPAGALAGAGAGAVGGVGSLVTGAIQASNDITLLDISQNGSFDIQAFQLSLTGQSSVASFNAWKQALSAVSGGGTAHRLASAWRTITGQVFDVVISVPAAERISALLSEWRRYGYMIGQAFTPPRLDVMSHWSYWQLTEPTILGQLPQSSRAAVTSAFERGVTVWRAVAEIGTTPDNEPVPGVTY